MLYPFYTALNQFLAENDFDSFVEALCASFYAGVTGRPSIPPGVFFRITFVGYFEGLPSHRSIAWRCADSRSLAEFLGLGPAEETPDHSSISKTHKRLPKDVFDEVFRFILRVIVSATVSKHGKLLSRTRSELVERSFAHVCDTGGARRTWLRGLQSVTKRHLMKAAARNLSTIMRAICGIGSPRARPAHIGAGTPIGPRDR